MGGKNSKNDVAYKHIVTNMKIKDHSNCSGCPFRIYAKDEDKVSFGIGNLNGNFIFILPYYNINADVNNNTILSSLIKMLDKLEDFNLFDDVYITRLVKCYNNTNHNIFPAATSSCYKFLIYELNRLKAPNVVFFGDTYDDYINNCDTVGGYLINKNVYKVYNPAVLFYNNEDNKNKLFEDLSIIIKGYDNKFRV